MTLLGVRSAADELARQLDASHDTGLPPVIRRLEGARPALEAATVPRAEFTVALRTRLLAVAAVQPPAPVVEPAASRALAQHRPAAGRGQRRLGVTAGAMAGVVAVVGLGVAGSHSLPGDPFYGLKRSAEQVQLALASGDLDRGVAHLQFAATRLQEVKGLTDGRQVLSMAPIGSARVLAGAGGGGALTRRVESALSDMDVETHAGWSLLEAAYRSSHRSEPLRVLMRFSAEQDAEFGRLMPALPSGARLHAQRSLAMVRAVGSDAAALLGVPMCTGACSTSPAAPGSGTTGTSPGAPGARPGVGAPGAPGGGAPGGGGPGAPGGGAPGAPGGGAPGVSPCTCPSPGPAVRPGPAVPGVPLAPTSGAALPGGGPAVPAPGHGYGQPPVPPVATAAPLPQPVPPHVVPPVPAVPVLPAVTGLPTPPVHLRAP